MSGKKSGRKSGVKGQGQMNSHGDREKGEPKVIDFSLDYDDPSGEPVPLWADYVRRNLKRERKRK